MTHLLRLGIRKKRLTQENCFRFCNKYGLFIALTIKNTVHRESSVKDQVFFMKRRTLRQTEKVNKAREKRLNEDLNPKEENRTCGKTYKYVGRFIDLSYDCQLLADGCKVCRTEIYWPIIKMRV